MWVSNINNKFFKHLLFTLFLIFNLRKYKRGIFYKVVSMAFSRVTPVLISVGRLLIKSIPISICIKSIRSGFEGLGVGHDMLS